MLPHFLEQLPREVPLLDADVELPKEFLEDQDGVDEQHKQNKSDHTVSDKQLGFEVIHKAKQDHFVHADDQHDRLVKDLDVAQLLGVEGTRPGQVDAHEEAQRYVDHHLEAGLVRQVQTHRHEQDSPPNEEQVVELGSIALRAQTVRHALKHLI